MPVAEGLPPTPTGVLSFFCLYPPFLRPCAGFAPPLLAVRGGQPETQPPLLDLECHSALPIVIRLPAQVGVLLGVCSQPLFQVRVVGLHLNDTALLIKKDACCL